MVDSHTSKSSRIDRENRVQIAPVVMAVVTQAAEVVTIRAVVVQAVVVHTVVEPLPLCMAVAVACANAPGFECCVKSDTARKSRKNRTSVNLPMARSTSLKNKILKHVGTCETWTGGKVSIPVLGGRNSKKQETVDNP